ncbi:MAG: TlpA disulfide reductase family protein [Chitinophagaceae bacterium]
MKKTLSLLLLCFLCIIYTKAEITYCLIKGTVTGIPDGTAVVFIKNNSHGGADTMALSKTKGGEFLLKCQLHTEGFWGFIIISTLPGKYLTLLIEPAYFTIKSGATDWPNAIISGPLTDKAYRSFLKENDSLKAQQKLANKEQKEAITDSILRHRINFITTHPESSYSAFLITTTDLFDATHKQQEYDKLTARVQLSEFGKQLKNNIELLKSADMLKKGKLPSFAYVDTEGKRLRAIEDIIAMNKLTLIDFWASWCAPCRKQNPELIQLYKDYHSNGFDILGISLDSKVSLWKDAIVKDQLPWHHLIDPVGDWDAESFILFGLIDKAGKHLPQSILVDQQGNIIARNLEMPSLRKKIAELLDIQKITP